MTLAHLRKRFPLWTWSAERYGFAWHYVGQREGRTVVLHAVSALVGEDDYETRWLVDEGDKQTSFATFTLETLASAR